MKPALVSKKPVKKLTAHDLAFGIGRKVTVAELKELLSRPTGKGKDVEQARKEIKENLRQKRSSTQQDFHDAVLAYSRRNEKTISLEELKTILKN